MLSSTSNALKFLSSSFFDHSSTSKTGELKTSSSRRNRSSLLMGSFFFRVPGVLTRRSTGTSWQLSEGEEGSQPVDEPLVDELLTELVLIAGHINSYLCEKALILDNGMCSVLHQLLVDDSLSSASSSDDVWQKPGITSRLSKVHVCADDDERSSLGCIFSPSENQRASVGETQHSHESRTTPRFLSPSTYRSDSHLSPGMPLVPQCFLRLASNPDWVVSAEYSPLDGPQLPQSTTAQLLFTRDENEASSYGVAHLTHFV